MQAPDLHSSALRLERWFLENQRPLPWRAAYDPYHVWVSEVMLQQTRMEVVLPYFERFIARFPDVAALASSTDDEVASLWSGLGYYRRARMLRAGAEAVVQRFGGRVPEEPADLLSIPGIGRYTAGAIASIAFDRRAAIVDGNVTRVVSRLFATDDDPWPLANALVEACSSPRALNQALMELGALVCTPRNPSCDACPVNAHCLAFRSNRVDEFPRPREKKATRELKIDLFVISASDGRVLMRRESGPLMNAMYHLPHGDTSLLTGRPLSPSKRTRLGSFRHTVTTRKIQFDVYSAELSGIRDAGEEYEWIDPRELHAVPHPSYVKKALRLLRT